MGVGRFACVILPFLLTTASLICILIAMLAGITNHSLDMFEVDTKNMSISTNDLANLENLAKRMASPEPGNPLSYLTQAAQSSATTLAEHYTSGTNLTAADLGLADSYKVSLWNYCSVTGSKSNCTKGKFDWATKATNITLLESVANAATGSSNTTLPKTLKDSLKTFAVVTKWTEVVYIIAIILAAINLVMGIFAFFSRVGSCITWIVSGLSTVAVIAASLMATIESSIVVAAVKSTAKAYNVHASLNTSFLAVTWLACAFSIGAGLFWAFSICCCANDHKKNRKSQGDSEKLIPGGTGYQRVGDSHNFNNGQQTGVFNTGVPLRNVQPQSHGGAYEPYSHAAI
ncbi:hypothetical protein LOCC1_G007430 [Lachnellula occidentalis]|uniref:SUR7 family protein pun1 n=1 Tax=Lachnellula occidentalis TaxID=215460 RepID=A0A8H8RT95_9HELO|nr:hypothetical protein LOCC1_G007430 [Lachnellula occidentalis]